MMRMMAAVAALALAGGGEGPQDAAKISALVKQLSAEDWIDQARAAKELAGIGRPALEAVTDAAWKSNAPPIQYWAKAITEKVLGAGAPVVPAPAPAPAPASEPASANFAPDENDVGSVMFICNNALHGDKEVVLSRCPTCAKMKRFAYDYGSSPACFRCTVCKAKFTAVKCDACGQPPGPRTRIRTKRH
jgi:hypothetical protein